jgi:hypothetical protein
MLHQKLFSKLLQIELTNWFPDQAILESKVGGKVKFSFYKDKEREHSIS